ncbi:MAG: calcium:proton antiporter [Capsulimonadaceae bacterium]
MNALAPRERVIILLAVAGTIAAGVANGMHAPPVARFAVAGIALALLAATVSMSTEQVGERLGPGATGVLQGALANLPEMCVGVFGLRAGLITVVQSMLVGSILANNLLVLGLAIMAGGAVNGMQRFSREQPRTISSLMMLAVAAIMMPTIATQVHAPAAGHIEPATIVVSLVLLIVFLASLPVSLRGSAPVVEEDAEEQAAPALWPMWMSAGLLVMAGIGSAFVSDWFVDAMSPAILRLHISQAFTGLVIVAIAGNAVENAVAVQLARRNQMDYAVSVILNSGLQVALCLTPVLCLLSYVIGGPHLTLVMKPLLVVALFLSTLVSTVVVYDGESIWLEGAALVGLYIIIASQFWWG